MKVQKDTGMSKIVCATFPLESVTITVLIQLSGLLGTPDFKIRAENPKFRIIENIRITAETSINKQGY